MALPSPTRGKYIPIKCVSCHGPLLNEVRCQYQETGSLLKKVVEIAKLCPVPFYLYLGLHKFTVILLLRRHHVIFVQLKFGVTVLLHEYHMVSLRDRISFQHNLGLCKFAVISLIRLHDLVFVQDQFTVISL